MAAIEVFYDGKFPNRCSGNLVIKVDGKEIYNKYHCCRSTGSTLGISGEVFRGKLVWLDSNLYPKDIRDAVANVLKNFKVCCGGCV